jgi:capsular exopolysaccharide synthesis family protein
VNAERERFAEVASQFGANHPEYRKAAGRLREVTEQFEDARITLSQRIETEFQHAASREQMLKKAVAETKAELDAINASSLTYRTLKREAEGDRAIYEELVRRIRENGINATFQNSLFRIADQARPRDWHVYPNTTLNLMLAFLVSTTVAIAAAMLKESLDGTIRSPEDGTRGFSTQIIGSLPHVKVHNWPALGMRRSITSITSGHTADTELAVTQPVPYAYQEAMRVLRNSLILQNQVPKLRSILITSAMPGDGKSMVASELAITNAKYNNRTLLIDADGRRGCIHNRFAISNEAGLADVLAGRCNWRDAVIDAPGVRHLQILTAGASNDDMLHMHGALINLLVTVESECDLVIVDGPPVLGCADTLQLAAAVQGVLIVARTGKTEAKAVDAALETVARVGATPIGIVLNGITADDLPTYYRTEPYTPKNAASS